MTLNELNDSKGPEDIICTMMGPSCLWPNILAGNTLEGDVSDVIALDQLTSPFSPRKATKMSPKFSAKDGVSIYISIYTRVISWYLTSGEVQHAICLVYIKKSIRGRGPVS